MEKIIGFFSAIISVISLCLQHKSNKKQKQDNSLTRFDNKFYELLRLYRQCVDNLKLGTLEKQDVFRGLYYECLSHIQIVDTILNNHNAIDVNKEKRINIAFQIFYNGNEFANVNSSLDIISDDVERYKIYQELCEQYEKSKQDISEHNKAGETIAMKYISSFSPYEGHKNRIGIYFNNLHLIIEHIDKISDDVVSIEKKKECIAMIWSQLSEYELAIFYYYSLSNYDYYWYKDKKDCWIVKYKLLKSLTEGMAMGGYYPTDKLYDLGLSEEEINNYFEDV